jgi:hypothetical protein
MFSQNQNFVEITSVLAFSLPYLSNCVSVQSCRQSVKNSVADPDPGWGKIHSQDPG